VKDSCCQLLTQANAAMSAPGPETGTVPGCDVSRSCGACWSRKCQAGLLVPPFDAYCFLPDSHCYYRFAS